MKKYKKALLLLAAAAVLCLLIWGVPALVNYLRWQALVDSFTPNTARVPDFFAYI